MDGFSKGIALRFPRTECSNAFIYINNRPLFLDDSLCLNLVLVRWTRNDIINSPKVAHFDLIFQIFQCLPTDEMRRTLRRRQHFSPNWYGGGRSEKLATIWEISVGIFNYKPGESIRNAR